MTLRTTNGGLLKLKELVPYKSHYQTRLAHGRVTQQDQFEMMYCTGIGWIHSVVVDFGTVVNTPASPSTDRNLLDSNVQTSPAVLREFSLVLFRRQSARVWIEVRMTWR
jgi:hypothetical protein